MRRAMAWSVAAGALVLSVAGAQPQSAGTALVVQVRPEAHLNPAQVLLHFRVSADGASDLTSQTATIAAWVRAVPSQQIRITARLESLSGSQGPAPPSALQWTSSAVRGTAGGETARCTSGSFAGGAAQELVEGWGRSGTLACSVSFSLAEPRSLPAGEYSAVVSLSVGTM